MSSDVEIENIFERLNIKVDENLFKMALTHSSMTFENATPYNYERLEFLGDAVLKLVISDILYDNYPDYNEGRMTKIRAIVISDDTLANISRKINLQKLILLGKNEEKDNGREKNSVIACAFEAVLGVIYLSDSLDKVKLFVKELFDKIVKEVDKNLEFYNAKAVLQEYTQSKTKNVPDYVEISQSGEEHDKIFEYAIYYENEFLSSGKGKSKKEAQQNAAKKACIKLGILNEENDD